MKNKKIIWGTVIVVLLLLLIAVYTKMQYRKAYFSQQASSTLISENTSTQSNISEKEKEKIPEAINSEKKIESILVIGKRSGNAPEVTEGIPHIQLDQTSSEDIYSILVDKVYKIDGIENHESTSTFAGAPGFSVAEDLDINPAAMIKGREFGHIHANPGRGSLHLVLSVKNAEIVIEKGWGVDHPFALDGSIPGMVMVFAPRDDGELEIILDIIRASFAFATRQ